MLARYMSVLIFACGISVASAQQPQTPPSVFRSGWSTSITHRGPGGGYSATLFADANEKLESKLRVRFKEKNVECYLVPRAYGFDVVILSDRPLAKEEEQSVQSLIDESLPSVADMMRNEKKG
jgi:hypothetical protein